MLAMPALVMAVPGGCIMAEGSLLAVRGLLDLSTVLPPALAMPFDLAADGSLSIARPEVVIQSCNEGAHRVNAAFFPQDAAQYAGETQAMRCSSNGAKCIENPELI